MDGGCARAEDRRLTRGGIKNGERERVPQRRDRRRIKKKPLGLRERTVEVDGRERSG